MYCRQTFSYKISIHEECGNQEVIWDEFRKVCKFETVAFTFFKVLKFWSSIQNFRALKFLTDKESQVAKNDS